MTPPVSPKPDEATEVRDSPEAPPPPRLGLGFGLALAAAAAGSVVLFRLLNRMKVTGIENIPQEHENVLYCLNHNSILDNFAFELGAYMPRALLRPEYLPISLADRKFFFGDPGSGGIRDRVVALLGRHFLRHLRAYPVDRNQRDLDQVDRWIEMLRQNILIVFPEGTRSRTGEIGSGKAGVGKLIYQARPVVLPVHMRGMREILGVGKIVPRVFQTVRIAIGKPLDLSDLLSCPLPPGSTEAQMAFYKEISDRVLEAIRDLAPPEARPAT